MDFRGTKADLLRSINLIPAVLSGRHTDTLGLHSIFWGYVGNAALSCIREDYLTKLDGGTGLDGIKWAKLAVATLAKRKRAGRFDEDILIETGNLLQSLRPGDEEFPRANPDQVFQIAPDGVTVGTQEEKADWHQYGVGKNLPARPIVPPDGRLPIGWEVLIEAAMEKGLARVLEVMCAAGGIP